jgi:hypothetical protein
LPALEASAYGLVRYRALRLLAPITEGSCRAESTGSPAGNSPRSIQRLVSPTAAITACRCPAPYAGARRRSWRMRGRGSRRGERTGTIRDDGSGPARIGGTVSPNRPAGLPRQRGTRATVTSYKCPKAGRG